MSWIGSWFGRKPAPEIGCVAQAYLERTEQAQKDLLLIIEHLAERTERTADDEAIGEDIQGASHLCATPYHSLKEAQKGEIWALMNRLSTMIAPATVEGLRATRHGYASLSGWPTLLLGVILTFLVAVLLQTYTLFGTQTLDRLSEKNTELMDVYAQINTLETHKPELLPFDKDQRKQWEPSSLEYLHLEYRQDAVNSEIRTIFRDLYRWNSIWADPIALIFGRQGGEYWGLDCLSDDTGPCETWTKKLNAAIAEGKDTGDLWKSAPFHDLQIRYGSEAFARSNLEVLRGLILPVLYGALGAWVWLLRERYHQVRSRRLRSPVWGEYLQRVLLGAVFGATLGYLNLPSFLPETVANISLIGLAFIVGYNVEVVFWLFDQMFRKMREKRLEEEEVQARRHQLAARRQGGDATAEALPRKRLPPAVSGDLTEA